MGEQNQITWTDRYKGFVCFSEGLTVSPGVKITGTTQRDMELGEGLIITSDGDIQYAQDGNTDNALTFFDKGKSLALGYSMPKDGADTFSPVCAVNVPGNSTTVLKPKNKMLVSFLSEGNISQDVCVAEIRTSAATIEYFEDVNTHTVAFAFDAGVWKADEERVHVSPEMVGWGNWFKYIQTGVSILNKVLND